MWIANPIPFHQKRLRNVIQTWTCHNHETMIDVELTLVVLSCYSFYYCIIAVIQSIHHQTTLDMPYHIQSYLVKIMILIGNWFESYFNILAYMSCMWYKEYNIIRIVGSIPTTINEIKHLSPG